MAGDWLKIRNDLDDDPHVMRLRELLDFPDPDLVVGKLRRLWKYADRHTIDGRIPFGTQDMIDRIVEYMGFARALVIVGWLEFGADGHGPCAQIVRFSEHNGESAKRRAAHARETAQWRAQKRAHTAHHLAPRERDREDLGEESPKNPSCSEPPEAASEPTPGRPGTGPPLEVQEPQTPNNFPQDRELFTPDPAAVQDRGGEGSDPAARAENPGDPVLLNFPVVGDQDRHQWQLRMSALDKFQAAFPGMDVLGEFRKALLWCDCNPTKRKTARGMMPFLSRWLERSQNRAGGNHGPFKSGGVTGAVGPARIAPAARKYEGVQTIRINSGS